MTDISRHARDRMAQRDISIDHVEQAIAHPASLPKHDISNDTFEQSGFTDDGGILRIVRSRTDGLVVSVWWERKP